MAERPLMLNEINERSPLFTFLSFFLGLILFALVLFSVFLFWVNTTCFVVEVSGDSMKDTLLDGDVIYVKKNAKAQRGDIVILGVSDYRDTYTFSGDYIIKRLIATEGDVVKCENGVLSVMYAGSSTFTAVDEDYAIGATGEFYPRTVGEGEVFFMGDNRTVSYDSRTVGCFKTKDIVGVVPAWALRMRGFTAFWEGMRSSVTPVHN